MTTIDWTSQLSDQLTWHWDNQLRPRLEGLTDEEYFWEPVPGWSVRRRGTPSRAGINGGSGDFYIEFEFPEPTPTPVTSIAWRLGHIIVGVFGARLQNHFDGFEADYMTWPYAGTATEALAQLDQCYEQWVDGISKLDADALAAPCGAAEGPWADAPMATLILRIHHEAIHHGAEISLLRDLYQAR